jgi:hypothetical protein
LVWFGCVFFSTKHIKGNVLANGSSQDNFFCKNVGVLENKKCQLKSIVVVFPNDELASAVGNCRSEGRMRLLIVKASVTTVKRNSLVIYSKFVANMIYVKFNGNAYNAVGDWYGAINQEE